jgi:medium-chain acyl-[acyl-carrier-protein] hydrolase
MNPSVWTERFQIRSYDVDATRRASSTSLCRYFLEAAWNHAEALGLGFTHLRTQGKFWVLARFRCEMQQYPAWGDKVTLQTWPRGIKSLFAMREFELQDETGTRIAAGSSAWLVLDSVSKRPQKLHKLLPSLATLDGKAALGQDPEKLEDNGTWDNDCPITVRYTDIDVNQHVNSSRYVGWMLDAYPAGFHLQHSLRIMEVNYLSETLEGEQLTVRTRQSEPTVYSHSLIKPSGSEVCRARLEWTVTEQRAKQERPN